MWLKATIFLLAFVTVVMFTGAEAAAEAYPSANSLGRTYDTVSTNQPTMAAVGTPTLAIASNQTVPKINSMCCGDGCNPGRTDDYALNRWDGWKYNNGGIQVGGVKANIWNYSPWVQAEPGGGDFATAWTMLTTDHPYGTDAGYAQIGWLEWQGGSRVTFEEFHEYGGGHTDKYNTDLKVQPVNVYTYYVTLYNPSTNTISFRQNSTNGTWLIHPQTWRPAEGQVSGETLSLASQMPGGASGPAAYEDFFDSEIYIGGWQRFPNPGSNVSTFMADYYGNYQANWFGQTVPSNGNISIYDLFCPN